jgi:photosystem II cytochrome c550
MLTFGWPQGFLPSESLCQRLAASRLAPHKGWRLLTAIATLWLALTVFSPPAYADVDTYVNRFLHVTDPIALKLNDQGETQSFTAEDISNGLRLFKANCINCHVGGNTLPNPAVSLSLEALRHATPPRDTIRGLTQFFRRPMTYDGQEESFVCREVPEEWLSQQETEQLAAFILRAAETAPAWATETGQDG